MKQIYLLLLLIFITVATRAQTLQAVNPNSGTVGTQALLLEISGSNLNFNQGTSTQLIFSNQVTGYEIYGYNFSSAGANAVYTNIDIAYAADTGLYDLSIKNNTTNQLTLNNAFRVLPFVSSTPTMSISPSSAGLNTFPLVSVTGHLTHFTASASFYIQLPGEGNFVNGQVSQITNDSSALVSFNLNSFFVLPGVYNFYVQDSRDNQVLSTNQFTVTGSMPQIVRATPDSAAANTTLDVNISGLNTNFTSATSTEIVWLDKSGFIIYPVQTFLVEDTLIVSQFSIPANAPNGYYDIHTFDPLDGELVKPNGFYIYDGVSGVKDISEYVTGVQLFPNPTANRANLVLDMLSEQWVSVSLYNTTGQIIIRKRIFAAAGKSNYDIDVSQLSDGMYIVSIDADGQQLHRQLIVAH